MAMAPEPNLPKGEPSESEPRPDEPRPNDQHQQEHPPRAAQRDDAPQSEPGQARSDVLQRAAQGDAPAWEEIVRRFGPAVLAICRRAGIQPTDRADVFQEVFRAVFTSIRKLQFGNSEAAFLAWLIKVAQTRVADYFRRKSREPPAAGGTANQNALQELAYSSHAPNAKSSRELEQLAASIEIVSQEFAPKTWRAFWRTAADGIPPEQVARELRMTAAGVRKAKSRVLRRLRELMPPSMPVLDKEDDAS